MIEVLKCHMSESSSGRGKELRHREKLFLLATVNIVIKVCEYMLHIEIKNKGKKKKLKWTRLFNSAVKLLTPAAQHSDIIYTYT